MIGGWETPEPLRALQGTPLSVALGLHARAVRGGHSRRFKSSPSRCDLYSRKQTWGLAARSVWKRGRCYHLPAQRLPGLAV